MPFVWLCGEGMVVSPVTATVHQQQLSTKPQCYHSAWALRMMAYLALLLDVASDKGTPGLWAELLV